MHPAIEWTVVVLLLIGSVFLLVGSVGLARLPDFFTRLHAPTKASTLGIGGVLIASCLYFSIEQDGLSVKELVITLFLFITAPITAHMLAKAALHQDSPPLERTRNSDLMTPAKDRESP
ncbi:Na+/H+ antiporter subunit G [Saccharospirillum mangrovi]|uniref:Na+/H+ antiporter subunit G n=1 Tax=Saccharospirillum mangrovi TaxID=2161747 RepID=UPI000D36DE33|nr:Na+/H+ antiporter subunit G [Saccharospirillum mangrovi]